MILNSTFFSDPLATGLIRRYILSKLTNETIPDESEYNGKNYPLYHGCHIRNFSSDPMDHTMIYNGFVFYCIGNRDSIESQISEYFKINRDSTIDDILKD